MEWQQAYLHCSTTEKEFLVWYSSYYQLHTRYVRFNVEKCFSFNRSHITALSNCIRLKPLKSGVCVPSSCNLEIPPTRCLTPSKVQMFQDNLKKKKKKKNSQNVIKKVKLQPLCFATRGRSYGRSQRMYIVCVHTCTRTLLLCLIACGFVYS